MSRFCPLLVLVLVVGGAVVWQLGSMRSDGAEFREGQTVMVYAGATHRVGVIGRVRPCDAGGFSFLVRYRDDAGELEGDGRWFRGAALAKWHVVKTHRPAPIVVGSPGSSSRPPE